MLRSRIAHFLVGASVVAACVGDDPASTVGDPPDAAGSSGTGLADAAAQDGPDGSVLDGGADRVKKLAAGYSSSCALYASGALICWGSNLHGELGTQTNPTERVRPVRVPFARPIIDVASGAYTTCAIDDQQVLWCWGDNQFGGVAVLPDASPDCGNGRTCQPTPLAVPGLSVKQLAVGHHMGCAISQDDHVYCWGTNSTSQSAQPLATRFVSPPMIVSNVSKVKKLAFGYGGRVACALDSAGAVWCWGDNHEGGLGHAAGTAGDLQDGGVATNAVPQKVEFPVEVGSAKVVDLTAAATVCAALDNGKVYCWGRNAGNELQLAAPDALAHPSPTLLEGVSGVTAVSGTSAFCALEGESTPMCWGPGVVATGSAVTDAGCKSAASNTAVPCRGIGPVSGPKFTQISVGAVHALGLTADGLVYAWGDDGAGRTGIEDVAGKTDGGTFVSTPLPVDGLP